MLRLALTPRWLAGLALVIVLATTFVALSAWQANRAQHKNDVQHSENVDVKTPLRDVVTAQEPMANIDADRLVETSGQFVPNTTVLVDGRYQRDGDGQRGYWVVTMFQVSDATLASGLPADRPVAIPVVRGFTNEKSTAEVSAAPQGTRTIVARLGPTEGPEPQVVPAQGDGQASDGRRMVTTVSTAQLVNFFDVYSYGGILFPQPESQAQVAGPELQHVEFSAQESSGIDTQSAFYAIEWLVFAGFAFYMWWRMLRDAYLKRQRERGNSGEFIVVKKPGERFVHKPGTEPSDKPGDQREGT